ncbi:MAG: Alkyl hydroperoxide reductase, F subunit [Parcubacteria group bacterium GW2011_GWA2_39_18]|nr:MAG: Alkyl hydroperoxide reductase, F subunit [Parcubacteria group bacterium GW2011_GWA2_39_18]
MLDLIIVGSSAAGAAAGIWAARRNLKFKIITIDTGGEVALSGEVSNYPGVIETNGFDLAKKFKEHLDYYKVDIQTDSDVKEIKKEGNVFIISGTQLGKNFEERSKVIVLATGSKSKHLNVPNEKEFYHKGVSYCTVCDGPLFKDKVVATIGGGNSALESAIMLSSIAKKVYLINKNPEFKGEKILIEKIKNLPNIEIINGALTQEIKGGNFVEKLVYEKEGRLNELNVEGVFIHIGMVPNSQMVPQDVRKNDLGEVEINTKCETSLLGFFAAGDVTNVPYKQIAIATGQGACAALSAISYLNSH